MASGPLGAMGHNPAFELRELRGDIEFDPASPAASTLHFAAAARSLALVDGAADSDRREIERTTQHDVLETARYPEITYVCGPGQVLAAGSMQLTLRGDLTLHGVTRPQPVSARVYLMGDTLRAQGQAVLKQTEHGIRPVSVAGGLLKVKDEVTLTFEIVARQVSGTEAGRPAELHREPQGSGTQPRAT
jgi:polyisoprenoid-binding protein YceI